MRGIIMEALFMAKITLKSALCVLTALYAVNGQAQIRESDYFLQSDFYDEFSVLTPGQFTVQTHDFRKMSDYANFIAPEASTREFISTVQRATGDYRVFDLCAARDEARRNDVAFSFLVDTSMSSDAIGAVALCAPSGVLRAKALKRLEERHDPFLISIAAAVCPHEKTRTRAFEALYSCYLAQRNKIHSPSEYVPFTAQQQALGDYFESFGFLAAISPNITQQEIALNIILRGECSADSAEEALPAPIMTDGLRSYLMHTKDPIKGGQAFELFLNHETTTLKDVVEIIAFHKGSVEFSNEMVEWFVSPRHQETVQRLIDNSGLGQFDAPKNPDEAKLLIGFVKKVLLSH